MDRATRLVISNQLEILKHLDPDQKEEYELQQEIIRSGYTSRYNEVFNDLSEEEADAKMQQEVWDILGMFRALNNARLRGWVASDPEAAKYEGFDANNDPHQWFAAHLLDNSDLFEESAPNKNSHSVSTLPTYRRMLAVWKKSVDMYKLTDEEAEAIITA
ncbi:YfbU family protein [Brucella anthropi]|uniref:YfbU family protein n=1 Tax=Brucella anthropi TaxID=529 RepID=UPI002672A78E|nr:YfbU family protein [Brucella anthropi]WKT91479.1 YfbU family protein [Brucella anthropi]